MFIREYHEKTRPKMIDNAKKYLAQQHPPVIENISFSFQQIQNGRYMKGWIDLYITFDQSYMVRFWLSSAFDPFCEFKGFVSKMLKNEGALLNIDEEPTAISLVVLPGENGQVRFAGFIDLLFYQDEEYREDFRSIFDVVIDKEHFIDTLFQSFEFFMLNEYKIEEWEYIRFNPLLDADLPQESYKYFKKLLQNYRSKKDIGNTYISKKITEAIELIKEGKTVHITKIKSLNRLKCPFYEFSRFIANKILSYFKKGESLCIEVVPKEQKERILHKAVVLINRCFDDTACDIGLPKEIESVFDEIEEMISGTKRLYAHVRRCTLKDADLMAMKECLGFFINNRNKYPGIWKREYDIATYYCVSYSDMRFRLGRESLPRLADILDFVAECVVDEK